MTLNTLVTYDQFDVLLHYIAREVTQTYSSFLP